MVMPQLSWLVWLVAALLGGQAACTERRPCVTMDPAPPWSDSPLLLSDYQVCKLTTHEIELQGEHLHFDTEVDRIRRVVEANNWRPISESYLHSESRYIYVVSAEGTQFRLNLTTAKQFRNAPVVLQIERRLVALR
ncbi:MAG: hypothetical protein HUU55_22845 [Myxococcales bacterium]|nr:hypothetical protein [Myxococcales bacterium]